MRDASLFAVRERSASGFSERAESANLFPLWETETVHQTGGPRPENPLHIQWGTILPLVMDAIRETGVHNAERRVLLMSNPALDDGKASLRSTSVIQSAVQALMPGETARAHRHTANALRFVVQDGGETYTNVDGQSCPMHPGDVILTPAGTWHSHHHSGHQPTIWYDVLDAPILGYLDACFFEPWEDRTNAMPETVSEDCFVECGFAPVLPAEVNAIHSPRFRYPWAATKAALAKAPVGDDGAKRVRLVNPIDGGLALPPLDCSMAALGTSPTREHRTTAGTLCIVAEGSGSSMIGDTRINWRQHDVFTIPHWSWASHAADEGEAILFMVSDKGVLTGNRWLREELR